MKTTENKWFVANDNGDIIGHDMSETSAKLLADCDPEGPTKEQEKEQDLFLENVAKEVLNCK